MAKSKLFLVLMVLAAFAFTSVASVSASVAAPVKGPRVVYIIIKHRKIHKRRRHHHRHHKKTAKTTGATGVAPVTTGINPVKG